jgi:hypothetical protein
MTKKLCPLFLSLLLLPSAAFADDVEEAIDAGLKHYKAKEYSQASAQLDYASTLIRQAKAEQVKKAFPDAPSGWTAEEASAEAAGAAMFGGGISAKRSYYKGDDYITMELMIDSPMIQMVSAMFSNPSMITMSGGKLIKIQGVNAILRGETTDSAEIQFITPGNAVVNLRGPGSQQAVMQELANKLDFKKL